MPNTDQAPTEDPYTIVMPAHMIPSFQAWLAETMSCYLSVPTSINGEPIRFVFPMRDRSLHS